MNIRSIILAGGEGTRLGVLTAKRTKPAVPFAGKYRIIDFALSNCVNSRLFDVMLVAQYRPHSLIEHIGAGGPWDLDRDFTGGLRILTPYRARGSSWLSHDGGSCSLSAIAVQGQREARLSTRPRARTRPLSTRTPTKPAIAVLHIPSPMAGTV